VGGNTSSDSHSSSSSVAWPASEGRSVAACIAMPPARPLPPTTLPTWVRISAPSVRSCVVHFISTHHKIQPSSLGSARTQPQQQQTQASAGALGFEGEDRAAIHGATRSALGRMVRDCHQAAIVGGQATGGRASPSDSSTACASANIAHSSVGVSDSGALPFVRLMHALTEMVLVHNLASDVSY
jgi:hypothetical protein